MARPRPAKKRAPEPSAPSVRVLPMQLKLGDRITDETGEYEVVGRLYTTNQGKNVHVLVRRVDQQASSS